MPHSWYILFREWGQSRRLMRRWGEALKRQLLMASSSREAPVKSVGTRMMLDLKNITELTVEDAENMTLQFTAGLKPWTGPTIKKRAKKPSL